MSLTQPEIGELVPRNWVSAFNKVLISMTSQEYEVKSVQPGPEGTDEPRDETCVWWSQDCSLLSGPAVWVGASNAAWEALGSAIVAVPGVQNAVQPDSQLASRDAIAQSTAAMVQELTKIFQTEINCGDPEPSDEPSGNPVVLSVSGPGKSNPFTLRVVFNAALFEELAKISSILDPHFGATSASPQNSDSERAFSLPKAIADLLLQLHVTLGRTTLPLDSVLKLNVGSVIELGRAPNAPVDVVVNGRIIASGQVVACNGNYGVRIVAADQREMGGEQCPREC